MMESRRRFLEISAGAALASRTVLGANDRVQVGLIGFGRRAGQIRNSFAKLPDCVFAAACDVDQTRLKQAATAIGGSVDTYGDYRRILERKDIDAVVIATPDHWHSPMLIAACEAGKDVYIEKPVSNEVEPAWKMVEAAKKYNRVVQVGCQQRSWPHFQEWAKKIQDGYLGRINHCILSFEGGGGGGARRPPAAEKVPEGLDWEAFQGPAPRRPYSSDRQRGWRSYFDYGGGTVTDWGIHFTDCMNWYMNAGRKAPILASASGQYIGMQPPNLDVAPDTYSVTWQYDNFVGTFTNTALPSQDPEMVRTDLHGNYFHGQNGVLLVNRYGYSVMPRRGGPPGASSAQAVTAARVMDPEGMLETPDSKFAAATTQHGRNFLDCVKSRQQPVCDMETGFYSSLPCLLAVMSIRQGRSFAWDGKAAKAV